MATLASLSSNPATLNLKFNDVTVDAVELWATIDGPMVSLNGLKDALAKTGLQMSPRDILLTGTALGLYLVQ